MPMSQSTGHLQVPNDLTKQCQLHTGKLIEYICHDHNTLGCSPCVTLNHRNCKIDYIPDVSKKYQISDEYKKQLQSLADLQKQLKTILEEEKANRKKILENKSFVKDEIKKFRREINNLFDNFETSVLEQVDDIYTMESEKMDSLSSRSIELEREIDELQKDTNTLDRAKKINALYIHSKENKDFVQRCYSAVELTCKDNYVNKFIFQPNKQVKEILESKTGIGELQKYETVCPNKCFKTDVGSFETLTAKFCDEIIVKVHPDETECCISGAVLIAKDTVAIADSANFAVKIVDTKINKVTKVEIFSSRPNALEFLPNDTLAVTLTNDKTIVFLSISNGLSEVRRLVVDGECYKVAYRNNELIVAFEWPGKIQVMNLYGKVNQFVQKDAFDNVLKCPKIASYLKNTIYFSDWSTHTVTSMNLYGKVLKSYKDERFIKPCGMVVLDDGSILVCSSGNNSIFLLSENLDKIRVILEEKDGLFCPWSLALDKENKKLYVGSGKQYNFLKVYDLN